MDNYDLLRKFNGRMVRITNHRGDVTIGTLMYEANYDPYNCKVVGNCFTAHFGYDDIPSLHISLEE